MARFLSLILLLFAAALANESSNKQRNRRSSAKCNLARSSNLVLLSNEKMYFFSYPAQKTWNSAKETCSKKGLHLATMTDVNELQVVGEEARGIYLDNGWHVSAKNQGSGGGKDFRWRDGTKLELNSPLWQEGTRKAGDCVRIDNSRKGKLVSYSCTDERPFVCELPSECY
ncbi:uncharacterized protein LOC132193963 [Neocloeon triangulifer]|uniref:uncharacterized protein LOC132193963 n=1 Tax=Neocloeon triangulifer TaxID=2078957 RepID=UPI00286EC18F|nr:uncharacterized protein LOC132193963 [Neocloeon triangulifer]